MITLKHLMIQDKSKTLVDVAFSISQATALVGQSGSGKSLTLKALLGMVDSNLTTQLDIESPFELERGRSVAYVPQNPFTALSPLTKIEKQFFLPKAEAQRLMALVELHVGLLERYPSELSGGQLQRVVLAMALSANPKLLLLDEPTTALDSQSKQQVNALLRRLQAEMGFLMLYVTHDILSIAELCSHIVVIKEGIVVEAAEAKTLLQTPQQAYTKILLESSFERRAYRL